MNRLSVGGFVTEVVGDSGRCDILDEFQISWMQFTYKYFGNLTWDNPGLFDPYCTDPSDINLCMNENEVKTWSRTYAKAVAGTTHLFRFNSTTKESELRYISNPACSLPTVIFVSEKWIYTNGFDVLVEPADRVQWSYSEPDHVIVTTTEKRPINITVTITPR